MQQGEMLATRWFDTILFVLCAALLTDFCRCATVTKEAALELKVDFNEDFDNDFGKGTLTEDTGNLDKVDNDDDEEDRDAEDLPEDEGADDGEDNGEQDTDDRDYVGEDKDDENEDESIYEDEDYLDEEDDFGEGDEIIDQDEDEDEEKGGDLSYVTAMEEANELEILPRDEKNKNGGKISRLEEN